MPGELFVRFAQIQNVNAYTSNKMSRSNQKNIDYSLAMRYNKVNRFTKTIYRNACEEGSLFPKTAECPMCG